jgi:excisionase family DNA binding protein
VPEAASARPSETLEPLLSIDEAAAVLGISPRGLYRLIGRSDVVTVKVGNCTRIEPRELRRFIAARRKRPYEEAEDE